MKLLRFTAGYIKPFWPSILLSFVCVAVVTALTVKMPDIFRDLMDRVFIRKDLGMLWNVCLWVILIFLFKGIFSWLQSYLMAFAGQRMVVNLRNDLYGHLQELPIDFYEERHTGEVISTLTNDINVVQAALAGGALNIIAALAILAGSVVKMLQLNWQLTLLTMVVLPLIALVVGFFSNRIQAITDSVQRKLADITTIIQETVSGIRIVKSFSMEKHEIKRFQAENEKNFQFVMQGARASATLTPVMDFLFAIGAVIILWYGGIKVINGHLSPGEFMAFILLLALASSPLATMGTYINSLSQAAAALARLAGLLDEAPEVRDAPGAINIPQIAGRILFEGVSFSYRNGAPVLSDINLDIAPGQVVALVGPSGAGKSTLVNLIPRFYGNYEGRIYIDDHPLDRIKLVSLRKQIGIVPQDTLLFGGSIGDNILYGDLTASPDAVIAAAKAANAHDFVAALPRGYDTEVGERGLRLSGGQRQRIAVARAILRNPRILILDEATSSLDTHSEMMVQEALDRLMKGRTTLVIAHRLSTIRKADRIVVLKGGRMVEQGSHEELLAHGGVYAGLYRAQFKDDDGLPAGLTAVREEGS